MAMQVASFLMDEEVGSELLEHMHSLSMLSVSPEMVTVKSCDSLGTV